MDSFMYDNHVGSQNVDQESDSYDTDSEEQKMLELEANLYSKLHYAEDLSNIMHEIDTSVTNDEHSIPTNMRDPRINSVFTGQNVANAGYIEPLADEDNHIATSLFNEILKAKELQGSKSPYSDPQSDSGMSSCKGDESSRSESSKQEKGTCEGIDSNLRIRNISDSKYASSIPKVKRGDISANGTNKDNMTIELSDSETSSDEDSGIRVLKEVNKNDTKYPIVDLKSDDDSCDDLEHSKFLEDIKGMDVSNDANMTVVEISSADATSSDSEIELMPNSECKSFKEKKMKEQVINTSIKKLDGHNSSLLETLSDSKNLSKHQTSSVTKQIKRKVIVVHHDDKNKKLLPKNAVDLNFSSDSASSDDENTLEITSLSLNVVGNTIGSDTPTLTFDEIIQTESDSFTANVRQQCTMLKVPHEEVFIRNWTSEMYKFYNEINKEKGNVQKLYSFIYYIMTWSIVVHIPKLLV